MSRIAGSILGRAGKVGIEILAEAKRDPARHIVRDLGILGIMSKLHEIGT